MPMYKLHNWLIATAKIRLLISFWHQTYKKICKITCKIFPTKATAL